MPRTTTPLPYVALSTTLVLWASAFVAIRHLGEDISPGALALARQGVAAVALGVVVLARGPRFPARRDLPVIAIIGLLWFCIYPVALNAAELHVDAGTAAMLLQVSPALVTVLAVAFLGESASRKLGVGLAVAFAGVVLIGVSNSGGHRDVLGVVLCLVSALAYCISVILQKPLLTRVPALEVTFLACVMGALACLPWAGTMVHDLRAAPAASVWWVVYLGVLPTAVAFTTWAIALSHLSASTMGISTYLVPPLTIVIAWLLLAETPPALAYAGGALALAGVAIARRPPRRSAGPPSGAASTAQTARAAEGARGGQDAAIDETAPG